MPRYMGNAGHLMQHWTLCELLDIASKKQTPGLSFIDAHAMAPLADERRHANAIFDSARVCPPDERSVYQRAWHYLAPISGYPSSAAFVNQVWQGDFSMLLCETEPATIAALNAWLPAIGGQQRCYNPEVFPGDWRDRFAAGLPNPAAPIAELPEGSLTLVSFDPYMYNSRRMFNDPQPRNNGNLYPDDLAAALGSINMIEGGILIQLSTYDVNDDNPQGVVISSVNSIIVAAGFTLCAVVWLNKSMMSLVYARNVPWRNVPWMVELADLPQRFINWIAPLRRRRRQ